MVEHYDSSLSGLRDSFQVKKIRILKTHTLPRAGTFKLNQITTLTQSHMSAI